MPPPSAVKGGRLRRAKVRLGDVASITLIMVSVVAVSVLAARYVPFLRAAEQWLTDLRASAAAEPQDQHPDIVMVVVTEDTLADLPYRSPFDRGFLAALLRRLDAAGAKAIGVDLLMDQPTEPAKDQDLRQTLAALRAPVVVAWADQHDGLTERQSAYVAELLDGVPAGAVTLLSDPYDAVVRWIYPGRARAGGYVDGFPGAILAALGKEPPQQPVPLVYRVGPDGATPPFRSYPAHLVPMLPAKWFEGRIVLIGSDLPHTDRHRTPATLAGGEAAPTQPGIELQAHALAQLLDGVTAPVLDPSTEVITVTFVALVAMLLGSLNLPVAPHLAIGIVAYAGFWLAAFGLYTYGRVLIPIVSPNLAIALAFAVGNAFWHGRTRRQSNFIRGAFSRFTSPAIVKELISDPDRLRLGGEKREITCLFTDIAGFTAWLEQADPELALVTLNGYLDGMCEIAFAHDATINKILGDGLHLLFGAPVNQPDHALRAVRCALAMDAFAGRYAAAQQAAGIPFGGTRIGVHSGIAVVGNFGGDRFFDYTAYGDMVNTASRLEGANKHLGTRICVSRPTADQAPGTLFRPIGGLVLVGKSEPIETLEPLATDAPEAQYYNDYLEAFALLREDEVSAGEKLAEILRRWPEDHLVAFYLGRLKRGIGGTLIRMAEK